MGAFEEAVGQLRERLTIQQNTPSTDSHGGRSSSWGTLATVWGSVLPITGAERLQAQMVNSQVTWRMEIRYRADVTAKMRVQWTPYTGTARTFEIHAVTVKDGHPDRLVLDCGEAV